MFWFLLIALVAVVAAVTLAVVGGDDGAALPEAEPDRLYDPLPVSRPVGRADVETVRFAVVPRGYRMADVDDVLGRLGAELAERDARIAELESSLAGAQAAALGGPDLLSKDGVPRGSGNGLPAADSGPGPESVAGADSVPGPGGAGGRSASTHGFPEAGTGVPAETRDSAAGRGRAAGIESGAGIGSGDVERSGDGGGPAADRGSEPDRSPGADGRRAAGDGGQA